MRSRSRLTDVLVGCTAALLALASLGGCRAPQDGSGVAAPGGQRTGATAASATTATPTGSGQAGAGRTAPTPSRTATPPGSTPATPATSAAKPVPTTAQPPAGCPQGDRQREVEGYLAQLGGFGPVVVDGVQSAADCAAIRKFQQRFGISPAEGRAGPTTADVARRLASTRTGDCHSGTGTTICVNLTLQTVWVLRDGAVVLGPTVIRTGKPGYATPAGTFHIGYRNLREWSVPYSVWMPYWQQFYDGMGFHETTTYIHDMSIGSHGCANLLHADAVALWGLTAVGTTAYFFGRRPGT